MRLKIKMVPSHLAATLYGGLCGIILLVLSYKIGHNFHHWMFGISILALNSPIVIVQAFVPDEFYFLPAVLFVMLGVASLAMDWHDFKAWLADRQKP